MTEQVVLPYRAADRGGTPMLRMILLQVALAAAYFIAGKIGLQLAFEHPSATAVWPPTGIALVAVLLLGWGVWPALFAGAFLVNITTQGTTAPAATGIALGNTLEALAGAWLVRRFARGSAALEHPHDVIRFALLAGVVSTTISATIGVLILALNGLAHWDHLAPVWLTWWLGDASSNLIVAPLLLAWIGKTLPRITPARLLEAVALLAVVVLVGLVAVAGWIPIEDDPLAYLALIPLIWAALRFGSRGAASAAMILSAIALGGALRGAGPFVRDNANESLLLLQAFMATITLTGLVLAAVVAENRRAHEALRGAVDEAQAANSAKDRFIAVLSHELRTPLTPVLASLSSLETDPVLSSRARDEFDMIRRNVELEARLIDELLDLNRITRGKMQLQLQQVDVREVLEQALTICRAWNGSETPQQPCQPPRSSQPGSKVAQAIKIVTDWRAFNHWVHGDATRLGQVFRNLLDNARKFMPAGGTLTVRTVNPREGLLRIDVCDSGVGMPPDLLARLFQPFEQGHPAGSRFGGLGIGLAISRNIVEALGGSLEAHSEGPGRGSVFSVTVPTTAPLDASAPAISSADAPQAAAAAANGSVRILLVEDHLDSARALARLLEQAGHSVQIATTVAQAMRLAEQEPFDLLISDLGLPDGTGLQLMRDLKSRYGLRGIALTGYGMEQDIRNTQDAGFMEHITKPVDSEGLVAAIRRLAPSREASMHKSQ